MDFVVIGGVAVGFQGYARSTKDLDITYATDEANLERLGRVLVALHAHTSTRSRSPTHGRGRRRQA